MHNITEQLQNTGINNITFIKNHNSNTPSNLQYFWHEADTHKTQTFPPSLFGIHYLFPP